MDMLEDLVLQTATRTCVALKLYNYSTTLPCEHAASSSSSKLFDLALGVPAMLLKMWLKERGSKPADRGNHTVSAKLTNLAGCVLE